MKREKTVWQSNETTRKYLRTIDWLIAILLVILSAISITIGIMPILFNSENSITKTYTVIVLFISLVIIILILILYILKYVLFRNTDVTARQYAREKKINRINSTLFEAISSLNSEKTRETLRHTYGTVPEWNPIDYQDNILLYDVHEQIRSILISLKKVVISIDPVRFNDKNVSVELVYCYPSEDPNAGCLPIRCGNLQSENWKPWKLISSGDTSGNHCKVLDYLENPQSFYSLLDYCGTKFANNKYCPMVNESEIEKIKQHWSTQGQFIDDFVPHCIFFEPDTKDMEYAQDGVLQGTAIGTVINVRNDDPEEVFVKAILTVNTYGEPLYVTENVREINKTCDNILAYDIHGLSIDDYKNILCNTIMGTYETLLASELSQMYIRHSIRKGQVCVLTGRKIKKQDTPCTLKILHCNQCDNVHCVRRRQQS